MARNRTWGDELTLRAIVEAYSCEAHVVTSEPANWYLAYSPENPNEPQDPAIATCPSNVLSSQTHSAAACKRRRVTPTVHVAFVAEGQSLPPVRKQIFLSYISPIHYNAIVALAS
jgi:hypothetical protein